MSNLKNHGAIFVKKKKLEKKNEYVVVVKRLGQVPIIWTFLLGYFCYINTILGFIPYKPHFIITLRFIVLLSSLPVVFSLKGFHVNLIFFFIFVFLYYFIDHNIIISSCMLDEPLN